jgi:hypothetical protein
LSKIGAIVDHKQDAGRLAENGQLLGLIEMRLRPIVFVAVLQDFHAGGKQA